MNAKKLEETSLSVAIDTEDLKCKIKTCENMKAKWRTVCSPHNNAAINYKENPSIKNKKLCDEFLEYQESEKQKKAEAKAAGPVCKNKECGETDEKKFRRDPRDNNWYSWCRRCSRICHEHSTPEKTCWKQCCVECKLAGKPQKKLCQDNKFCLTLYRHLDSCAKQGRQN